MNAEELQVAIAKARQKVNSIAEECNSLEQELRWEDEMLEAAIQELDALLDQQA